MPETLEQTEKELRPLSKIERDRLQEMYLATDLLGGKWRISQDETCIYNGIGFCLYGQSGWKAKENTQFVATAHQAVPRLLTQVDEQDKRIIELEKQLAEAQRQAKLANERAYSLEESLVQTSSPWNKG